jgi:hypothetical protein
VNANKIAVVDQGRIIEQGSHAELLVHGGIYAKLVQKQMQKMQNTLSERDPIFNTSSSSNGHVDNDGNGTQPQQQQQPLDVIDNLMQ